MLTGATLIFLLPPFCVVFTHTHYTVAGICSNAEDNTEETLGMNSRVVQKNIQGMHEGHEGHASTIPTLISPCPKHS